MRDRCFMKVIMLRMIISYFLKLHLINLIPEKMTGRICQSIQGSL